MNKDQAFEPFKNLEKCLNEIAAEIGLTVEQININIAEETLYVVWSLKADALLTEGEKEQRQIDEAFENIVAFELSDTQKAKFDKAKGDIFKYLSGDDDPTVS